MADQTHTDAGTHPIPLIALLGRAESEFIAEFDRRMKDTEFCALSLAHSRNVLRHLAGGPQRASAIVDQCGLSKQAISQQIAHLSANGYVTVEPDPSDHRARIVALTDKGASAQRLVKTMFGQIEQDWAAKIGVRDAAALRRALMKVLDNPVPRF